MIRTGHPFRTALAWLWRRGRFRITIATCVGLFLPFSGISNPIVMAFFSVLMIGIAVGTSDPANLTISRRLLPSWADYFGASRLILLATTLPVVAGALILESGFTNSMDMIRSLIAIAIVAIFSWASSKAKSFGAIPWLPISCSIVLLVVSEEWVGSIGQLAIGFFVLLAVYWLSKAQVSYAFAIKPGEDKETLYFDKSLQIALFAILGLNVYGINGLFFGSSCSIMLYYLLKSYVWLTRGFDLSSRIPSSPRLWASGLLVIVLPFFALKGVGIVVGNKSFLGSSSPPELLSFGMRFGLYVVFLVVWGLTERDRIEVCQKHQRQRPLMRRLPLTRAALTRKYLVALSPLLSRGFLWLAVAAILVAISSGKSSALSIGYLCLAMMLSLGGGIAAGSCLHALRVSSFLQVLASLTASILVFFIATRVSPKFALVGCAALVVTSVSMTYLQLGPGGILRSLFLAPIQRRFLAPAQRRVV